jgi:hypothetical protein
MREITRALVLAALAAGAQAAQAGYAGVWFQCQPRWTAEKNYLLVEVQRGERAWQAHWGADDSAQGAASQDKEGNLALRGCHALHGKPSAACNPAQPPLFATLPKAVAEGRGGPVEAALRRGTWVHTDTAGTQALARQCAALRPKAKG